MNTSKVVRYLKQEIKLFLGDKKAIVGVSGGLDSAVVLSLCARALGKLKVIGAVLPYKDQSCDDAKELCKSLEVEYRYFNIERLVDVFPYTSIIDYSEISDEEKLVRGNIMARTRMTYLYMVAGQTSGLVIGTGNKTEIAIGYYTKYGDGGVDFEPIGDLYKTEVRKVAKYLKLPSTFIKKSPSAELWVGQTDEQEIGMSYENLDEVLQGKSTKYDLYPKVGELQDKSNHKRKMPSIVPLLGIK